MLKKSLFTLAIVLFITQVASFGQPFNPMEKLTTSPDTKVGTLPNGLTYYIRHNAKPANQAEFYIVHNVGAIQEEDSQVGMAHFLEHMAFNGTKNLPDKQLIEYLESIGVKFGANLNAGTGVEFTYYMMSAVPMTRPQIVDSALLILHDWSHFIALEPAEIDAERGVIIEELRSRNDAAWRARSKSGPVLYGNTKYAERNILGSEESLRNFSYNELTDFYHRWYRPDMQAVIVVGDFDEAEMEAKIKAVMSDIPAVENPEPKEVIPIPDNVSPLVAVITDKETSMPSVQLYLKQQPAPRELRQTMLYQYNSLLEGFMMVALNERLVKIAQNPDSPYMIAMCSPTSITSTCNAYRAMAVARDGRVVDALDTVCRELEIMRRYGITQSEFDRTKIKLENSARNSLVSSADTRNDSFVKECMNNFLHSSPIVTPEESWRVDSLLLNAVTLEAVNAACAHRITDENRLVIVNLPENEKNPTVTEQQVREVVERAREGEYEAYQNEGAVKPLIPERTVLKGSKIRKTSTDKFGATVWKLRNGATVVALPTDYKADEVQMNAKKFGGASILPTEFLMAAGNYFTTGVGEFTTLELSRALAGKNASVKTSINRYTTSISGSAKSKDLETMMQLLYLNFTAPRFDKDKFDMTVSRAADSKRAGEGKPDAILSDTLRSVLYGGNPRRHSTTADELETLTIDDLRTIHDTFFAGVSDYTFTFVGNIDLDELRPLVEKYIGSLPKSKKAKWADEGVEMPKGEVTRIFDVEMQNPKSSVYYIFSGKTPYAIGNQIRFDVLGQMLNTRYLQVIREEKGGTYGVSVSPSVSQYPEGEYSIIVSFSTSPEQVEELREIIVDEIKKMATETPSDEDLAAIKEYYKKNRPERLRSNGYWLGVLDAYHVNGTDRYTDWQSAVDGLTVEQIQALARTIVDDGNIVRIVMNPKQ